MILRKSIVMLLLVLLVCASTSLGEGEGPALTVIFPKDHSIVGGKVNVVLDPGTDWSAMPFFQVSTQNQQYPVVDTSTGKHAFQGVDLKPGLNTITIKALVPVPEKEKKDNKPAYREVASRFITVFSLVELVTSRTPPPGFSSALFHSRENEAACSGCHALDLKADAPPPKKPEDEICYACHRSIPTGKHVHGPAVRWYCHGCHDPELYPVKYQFTAEDPWKVAKSFQSVSPMLFTLQNDALFIPGTANWVYPITTVKEKVKAKGKAKTTVVIPDKLKEQFAPVLEYAALNPGDKIRVEAHTDNTPLQKPTGKQDKGFKDSTALTKARALAVASLLQQLGVTGKNRIAAVGMGDKLPKDKNSTKEGRERNNRIEIVIYPQGVKIVNSATLPVLKDRERVTVNLSYLRGPSVKGLKVVEKMPKGTQYMKGTGAFHGRAKEPKIKGNEMTWDLGDLDQGLSESLTYISRKVKDAEPLSPVVTISYSVSGDRTLTREFDPKVPARKSHTVGDACKKCHPEVLEGTFKHGPVDAGFCTLCHDPHSSQYVAWLRKPTWSLCTTCHTEKATDVHVLAGYVRGKTHPTWSKQDPVRPGRHLSCTSCHMAHSAGTRYLYAFEARARNELCVVCHPKR